MSLAFIPSPSISQFSVGSFTIRFYAICILVGIVLAVWTTTVRWKRYGGNFDQILDITLCAVPAGIIGARLYHVVTTPERFFGPHGNPVDILRIWNGGLGIWGAVLLGGLAAWAWCRHRHYPTALLADALAPGLLVGQAVGRLGNWFNQELYGAPTKLPWGLRLNDSRYAIGSTEQCYDGRSCPVGTLFHPTFLYEMIWDLVGALLIVWLGRKVMNKLKAGSLFAVYVVWYTAGRTWIEALRIDFAHEILGIRVNVWVSAVVFVLGIIAFFLIQRFGGTTTTLAERLRTLTEAEVLAEEDATKTGKDDEDDGDAPSGESEFSQTPVHSQEPQESGARSAEAKQPEASVDSRQSQDRRNPTTAKESPESERRVQPNVKPSRKTDGTD